MPVKLTDLLAEKAKADIHVGGSTINFVYYAMWRERFTEEERAAHVNTPFHEYILLWLPKVVISWDLVDDDEHALPVTAEAIEQNEIPDSLLLAFHARIVNSDLSGKVTSSSLPGT